MIRLAKTGCIISRYPLYADSFFQRLTGMLTRKFSDKLDGIVFRNCNAVHTFGMRFEIDVLFITQDNRISALYPKVKPWKTCGTKHLRAAAVELPAGSIEKYGISTGDFIDFN